ncbi:unnamed protein product [Eruca vesicaria subsp. sativa]|uniref:Uncharacterized protein n=1 Tax=Eruca vesicaria subsp. sativa TaxID=29727 RepID=A0ABC8JZH5_ERUVS|nr:unnamed protein product [Eruca vesicaria subsp. sativa]
MSQTTKSKPLPPRVEFQRGDSGGSRRVHQHVAVDDWMRRVPSSEMLNTQQLLEMACRLPYDHLVRCLWEFICLCIPDSYDTLSTSDDDEVGSYACF